MNTTMRPSRVLAKLRAGEVVSSFKINLDSARAVELAARQGFDCIWVDMEHIASDWSLIERQVWAAKTHNTDLMVRVARGSYSDYVRPLELDAAGIIVPHLMSVADAQAIVRMTKFHPIGLRAVDGGNADGGYGVLGMTDYLEQANSNHFIAVQIEDPEPLDELDAIAAVEGIDILFFGPADFSQAIGCPGQWDHPQITEARHRVAEVCRKHGKVASTVGSLENLEELVELGFRFINIGADVLGLNQYTAERVQAFKTLSATRAGITAIAEERATRSTYS